MKKILLSLFFTFALSLLYCQDVSDFDKLMTRRILNCADIEENCRYLLPKYYEESKIDSMRFLLRYWREKCGEREPITRIEILLDEEVGILSKYEFAKRTIWHLLDFKRKREFVKQNPEVRMIYSNSFFFSRWEPINDEYDIFTALLALRLKSKSRISVSTEVTNFFSGNVDSMFINLNSNKFLNSSIQLSYDSIISEIKSEFNGYMSFTSGYWMPLNNAKILGDHPEVGVSFGAIRQRWSFDLMIIIKFLQSKQPYTVFHKGALTSTNHFFGGYIAAETGYDIAQYKSHDISCLGGIGYDGFDAVSSSSNAKDNLSINSLNLNVGMGTRIYLEEFKGSFLNFEVRYNFVSYKNEGGTDLKGNTLTFRVGYNILSSSNNKLLRELGAF